LLPTRSTCLRWEDEGESVGLASVRVRPVSPLLGPAWPVPSDGRSLRIRILALGSCALDGGCQHGQSVSLAPQASSLTRLSAVHWGPLFYLLSRCQQRPSPSPEPFVGWKPLGILPLGGPIRAPEVFPAQKILSIRVEAQTQDLMSTGQQDASSSYPHLRYTGSALSFPPRRRSVRGRGRMAR
jgi:hypothetical protein